MLLVKWNTWKILKSNFWHSSKSILREILETYKLAKTDYNSGLARLRRFVKQGVSHVHFCDLPTSKGEEIVQSRDS